MEKSVSEYIQMCQWDSSNFLIFSDNVFGNLIYYSHLLPLVVSFLFALFIFFKNPKFLAARWLLITTILLSIWLFFDLILWATEKPSFTMFFWSIVNMIEPMIYAGILFFMYALVDGRSISFKQKTVVFALLLPTVVFASTNLNLSVYDLTNCWREALEGPLPYYSYIIEGIFAFWIIGFGIKRFFQLQDRTKKKKVALVTFGAVFFLLSFAMGNVIGSLLVDWEIGQYGLFGAPIFVGFLTYVMVKYKAFNIKLLGAQALVFALGFLVLAILFIRKIENVRVVVFITLLIVIALGYALVKSVKKEVRQREQLAKLNLDLQKSIKLRESLMHIINHKVKGAFTHSKYIFAEMLDGMFGVISPELKKMAANGLASDNEGIATIDMALNQASLQAGTVKFDMKPFDFKQVVEEIVEDKRIPAETKKLKLETEIKDQDYTITGDRRWLKEAILNLVDNAVKCTVIGKITVGLELKEKQILFYVKDTGRGITDEDKKVLWTEGGRGQNSLQYNTDSTGYGLSTTKTVVEAHKGKVWVDSEVGKGSTFYVELPG